jgi:hypothetical protein
LVNLCRYPVVWMHVYYMLQQTYVLHVDTFLNAVSVGFVGAQFLLGFFAASGFPKKDGNAGRGGAVQRVAGGAGAGAAAQRVSYVGGGAGAGAIPSPTSPARPTFVVGR